VTHFWSKVEELDGRLERNGENIFVLVMNRGLRQTVIVRALRRLSAHVPPAEVVSTLFLGIDRNTINFTPIFNMAAELFTHLGIACTLYYQSAECEILIIAPGIVQNPGGPKSGVGTPYSVSEYVSKETDELLEIAGEQGFGKRKQEALKLLVRYHVCHTICY
jgi:hypothetical protein